MRIRIAIGALLEVAVLGLTYVGLDRLAARSGGTTQQNRDRPGTPPTPPSPIEALNRRVLERLHNAEGMGGSRISSAPEHKIRFPSYNFFVTESESAAETAADEKLIADLDRQGWTVALYLAGRGLLGPPMSESEWDQALADEHLDPHWKASPRRTVGSPIVVARGDFLAELPHARELWEIGQRALIASGSSDRLATSFGPWTVDVRPVRADRASCLKCHASDTDSDRSERDSSSPHAKDELAIGDPLGVAIYLYRRKPR